MERVPSPAQAAGQVLVTGTVTLPTSLPPGLHGMRADSRQGRLGVVILQLIGADGRPLRTAEAEISWRQGRWLTGAPRFLTDVPPEVAREALLHTWQSFNGSLRIVLTKPVAAPLERIGPKVVFVHGRADHITALERVRALAEAVGARVVETEDDHLSYPQRSAARVIATLEAR